ncbi:MAG: sigma-54-dependent Fis family transcriptional regulator [Acidobacteria bacterium]|nr:sigma-54-dependent Fis family transcriptional regulator [Acidobacteriota bacterium]
MPLHPLAAPAPSSLQRLLRGYPALAAGLRGIENAAATDAPVLILGEPGTGRSSLARAVHAASRRAAGPLVEVDPGAVPSALFESELFGYRPGAFTGAGTAGEGRVARAAGGTLLLDHVEELPLASQPKLLRLLAERRYVPLGGEETAADARFIAIGPDDLTGRMASGAFRPDLFYRLEVVAFRLPPLRERRADLPALLDAMLADLGERFGRPGLALAPAARAWMQEHTWPGNLRQLRNALERGLILAGHEPAPVLGVPGGPGPERALPDLIDPAPLDELPPAGASVRPPRPLAEVEQEQIRAALAFTRGHQGRAAGLLGISRKALWEKRRRYNIP